MNNSRHRRRKKRRNRTRAICIRMSAVLLLLVVTAIGLAWWKKPVKTNPLRKHTVSGQSKKETGQNTLTDTDASQEPSGNNEDNDTNADITAEAEDIRTVKNTATEEHHKTNGLSICMYHYVYDENDPPEEVNNNFIEVHALEEELKYLVENDYFFPTWEEVRKYIDGELLLPEKSVVLTFDDGAKSFLKLGVPLFNKYKIPVTSFLITSNDGDSKVKKYIQKPLKPQRKQLKRK